MAFKFPAGRHFRFYDVLRLPLLFGSFQTIAGAETGVTIQHSVDVVRLLIFSYMKYKSHFTFFFFSS